MQPIVRFQWNFAQGNRSAWRLTSHDTSSKFRTFKMADVRCTANIESSSSWRSSSSSCLWCCHHGRAITRVHPVHLMNVERCQAAADSRPSQTTRLWVRLYRLPETTPTIAIYYYYTARTPILIFTVPWRVEGWVDLGGWLQTETVYRPQTVTHPDTNRVWRSATALIKTKALPLSQTATH